MIHGLNLNEIDKENFNFIYKLDYIKLRETLGKQSKLDITGCSIKYITNDTIQILNNLIEINLSDNNLKKLNKTMFSSLTHLKSLNIGMNLIREIADGTFDNLENLERLDLAENHIRNITNKTFDGLNNLKCLDISNNFLTKTSLDNLLNSETLCNLDKLYIRNCNINKLEENQFISLKYLKTLDLSQNGINWLKKNAFNGLVNLKFLDLSSCNIRFADSKALKDLSCLVDLHIIDNPIEVNMGLDKLKTYLLC